jgi:hypothetical protein
VEVPLPPQQNGHRHHSEVRAPPPRPRDTRAANVAYAGRVWRAGCGVCAVRCTWPWPFLRHTLTAHGSGDRRYVESKGDKNCVIRAIWTPNLW